MKIIRRLGFLWISCITCSLHAQLRADFQPDKSGGCSPFAASFTNTSTGVSATATYSWDLGNGNLSVLKNAGAVYYSEGAYTVTLTVRDGGQTSIQTKTITVYKRPVIDFTYSPARICNPSMVSFSSTATAGDGAIASYRWDFGDGKTQQSSSAAISHYYDFEQTASVSLTAINSFGCSQSLIKENIVTVLPSIKADWQADQTLLCSAPANVRFTNHSAGPGTLRYEWNFGDGATSTESSPVHRYTLKGTYTVKMTVTSSEGCVAVLERPSYINVADYSTGMNIPSLLCSDYYYTINSTSAPTPVQNAWVIDGMPVYGNNSINYSFNTPGSHSVQLTSNFGNCQETVTKQIVVKKTPFVDGFIADIKGQCGAPVQVDFKDTTTGAVAWKWIFDVYNQQGTSNQQAASYTYAVDNYYYASLSVTSAEGCSSPAFAKAIPISKPLVGIFLENGFTTTGCDTLRTKFNYRTTESLTSFRWDFGDGSNSSESAPSHLYTRPGIYKVKMTYETAGGCTGTATFIYDIYVRPMPTANFVMPAAICGNTPAMINDYTTNATNEIWDFGDNSSIWDWLNGKQVHRYQSEGEFTVRLIAHNDYLCYDTTIRTIKVSSPFPKITGKANTCEGTRGLVTFSDGTRGAESWRWDFGDGKSLSYNDYRSTIRHEYARTGIYKAVLTTRNGACTVSDSIEVAVLLKQSPQLKLDQSTACAGSNLVYHVTGLEGNPAPVIAGYNHYELTGVQQSNGDPYDGYFYYFDYFFIQVSGNISFYQPVETSIRFTTVSSGFGCSDTTNYVAVHVKAVKAGFEVLSDNVCFKSPAVFRDTSRATAGAVISSWKWDFGDGNVQSFDHGGTVSHLYATPGTYYVTLTITDATGCSSVSSAVSGHYISVAGPKAAFYLSTGNTVQLNTTVYFYNNSDVANATHVNYYWNFGNGVTSMGFAPSYTYASSGSYEVVLVAENMETLCKDTTRQTIVVKDFNTGFTKYTTLIGNQGNCPPVQVGFTNTSINFTHLVWDFGDGFTLEDQAFPSHIYTKPGIYVVTLYVYGYNGLTGTYTDTIRAGVLTAAIRADDIDGCIGHRVILHAPEHSNARSYFWDFGDGNMVSTADSFATSQYLTPGVYTPSLLVKDEDGCTGNTVLASAVTIHPDPVIAISPSSPLVCKGTPVHLRASGAVTYSWAPAGGLSADDLEAPLVAPTVTTTYTVKASDANGCSGSGSVTVTVPQPFAMNVAGTADVCQGSKVQLQASGADHFAWINTTTGLNDTGIAGPTATPVISTNYTVTGFDAYNCYSDTQQVAVTVRPLPFVNGGQDLDVIFGSTNILKVTNSADVVRWRWTPADFLSCSNCPAPVSRPYTAMDYVVSVFTAYNCEAKDTIHIKATCTDAGVHIPNAFTPNNDGRNDVFAIGGYGVSVIRSFRVFNRWGGIVFEKKNFFPDDASGSWNGRLKGVDAPAGAYVYFVEMECTAGQRFERKGTVMLVR